MADRFPCTGCGACCAKVGLVLEVPRELYHPIYAAAIDEFPYKALENGACEMLDENNRCTVYETRPAICNIDTMIARLGYDRQQRYQLNAEMCNLLQEQAGIDPSYRVTLEENPTDGRRL